MIFALRLAGILGCAIIACAADGSSASFLWSGRNGVDVNEGAAARNWGPAKNTIGVAEIDPEGWTPTPTAPPGAKPIDLELRRRQRTTAAAASSSSVDICGYPIDNLNEPAIACTGGDYCYANVSAGAAGCCSKSNRQDCIVPTTCIESRSSITYQLNPRTLLCDDRTLPHCVTYLYAASFGEELHGFSFLACGERAGSSTIAPPTSVSTETSDGSTTASSETSSDISSTDGGATDSATPTASPSSSSSSSPSSSTEPIVAASTNSGNRTGAIVGGVIGGVAGLALIAAVIFFCLRHRKRKGARAKEVESSPPYASRDFAAANVYSGGLPEPAYTSDFYGELPPSMIQSTHNVGGYPPQTEYETNYDPIAVPRDIQRQSRHTTTYIPTSPKPNDDDIVSPITPGGQLNPADDPATYTWISNPTPPPQSDYSQFSPPPPAHFQSYRPYPGT